MPKLFLFLIVRFSKIILTNSVLYCIISFVVNRYAGMAELADALDSGSSEVTFVQVQVLLPAPKIRGVGLFCSPDF